MRVLPLINCGLQVSCNSASLLIDALNSPQTGFSAISAEQAKLIIDGEGPFATADSLFYSHCHPDHYQRELSVAYLLHDPARQLYLPDGQEYAALCRLGFSAQLHLLGRREQLELPGLELFSQHSLHSGRPYADVEHCSFALAGDDQLLYVAADADVGAPLNELAQLPAARIRRISGFFPPYFVASPAGREALRRYWVEQCFIYHLPFAEDDHFHLLRAVDLALRRHGEQLPHCLPAQAWQSLNIH